MGNKRRAQKTMLMSVAIVVATISISISDNSKATAQEREKINETPLPIQPKQLLLKKTSNPVTIVTPLDEMTDSTKGVLKYITKAELSKSGEDKYFAQLLIDNLDEKERALLMNRLNKIVIQHSYNTKHAVDLAKKEVDSAKENIHDEVQLKKAQQIVNDLYISEERTALVEELYEIHTQLLVEREKPKQ